MVLALVLALAACKREKREFRADPIARNEAGEISMVSIAAGSAPPEARGSALGAEYEGNAYHLSQGKKL
jgi:cytochrome c oxidase cbb3-type subunit III